MGHVLGLEDLYESRDELDLMYTQLGTGAAEIALEVIIDRLSLIDESEFERIA